VLKRLACSACFWCEVHNGLDIAAHSSYVSIAGHNAEHMPNGLHQRKTWPGGNTRWYLWRVTQNSLIVVAG